MLKNRFVGGAHRACTVCKVNDRGLATARQLRHPKLYLTCALSRVRERPGRLVALDIVETRHWCWRLGAAAVAAGQLGAVGLKADKMETTATISLEKVGEGFSITKRHLDLVAKIPGADQAKFDQAVKDELSYPKVKEIYIQAYKDTFTQEEVDAITVFYKSPAGKAI